MSPVRVGSSSHSDTNVCHSRSCLAPLSQQGCSTVGNCQYQGTGVDVVDHTAAKLWRLEAVRVASPQSLGSSDDYPSPLTATPKTPTPTPKAPIPKPAPKRGVKRTLETSMDRFFKPGTPAKHHSDIGVRGTEAAVPYSTSQVGSPQSMLSGRWCALLHHLPALLQALCPLHPSFFADLRM